MKINLGRGLHTGEGRRVDRSAYERYIGRWSRLFVPGVLAAGEVDAGHRVLDVATGTGEAASMTLSAVGPSGMVLGCDISLPMLEAADERFGGQPFQAVAADGQHLPFADSVFDVVICQLGLMFFPDPARALREFHRVLLPRHRAAVCVISTADRAPMWGTLAETLGRFIPEHRDIFHLSFALSDPEHLESLFTEAGFREVSVTREKRETPFESFADYWLSIEEGAGIMPEAYRALPESQRRAVREEMRARLAAFESNGRLEMSLEMLIASGARIDLF